MRRTGLVLGLLLVGQSARAATQNPRLAALPPNTAVDLGAYGCESPAGAGGHCASITDYSGMVYDRLGHRLLMFGGGHAGTSGTLRSDVSAFDFGTLAWSSDYVPTSCAEMNASNIDPVTGSWRSTGHPLARHTYDMLVMVDDPPRMLMTTSGAVGGETCSGPPASFPVGTKIAAYDPASKAWTYGTTDAGQWDSYATAELDPVSGQTIILGSHGLWAYDARTDAFAGAQFLPAELGYANNLVYARKADRMYYFARGDATRVFELTLDRAAWKDSKLTELDVIGPRSTETGYAYDEVNHVIGGGVLDGRFSAFDPASRTWNTVAMETDPPGGTIGSMAFHEIAYDPVDGVFVFVTDLAAGAHVWAYRYAGAAPAPGDPPSAAAPPAGSADPATPSAATSAGSGCAMTGTTGAGWIAGLVAALLVGTRRGRSAARR